ncbi:MAG: site-specific integrase [Verrucomicrobiota bacterium]
MLNVWHPTGKRERSFFETKEAAQAAEEVKKVEVQRLGWRALNIDDKLRLEALDARDKLAPYGVSLAVVVSEYIRRHGSATTTVDELAETFLASRTKLQRSAKHLTSLRCLFKRFGASFPKDRLADLTSDQVEDWLHDLNVGPVTVNSYRTLLHSLFEFAVRKKLCAENPVKAVERMTVKSDEVGILASQQLAKLLALAKEDVRATIAIGAFAGIRPEEIARLTWAEISLEKGHITVTAAKSKTAQHRYVKILPCLEAWLRPLIGSGSIQGDNFRRRYDETRRLAGFAVRGNQARRQDEDKSLPPWPHDALRHSFASYHLAKFQNAPALALELGHQSNALIFSNYRRRVTEAEAAEYFNLVPL